MTRRQQMMLAWAGICITRGIFYTPLHPGYGDFPAGLKQITPIHWVWVWGTVWMVVGLIGLAAIRWPRFESGFWLGLIPMMAAWGGIYIGGCIAGVQPGGWLGGALYVLVAYGMWASRGDEDDAEPIEIHRGS